MKRITGIGTIVFIVLVLSIFFVTTQNEEVHIKNEKKGDIQNYYNLNSYNTITEYSIVTENELLKIKLIQTRKKTPFTPEDEAFNIYKSAYYGEFNLFLLKDELIVDTLNLNECFELKDIGFIGKFTLVGDDINCDGFEDYNIGIMNDDEFEFVVFTVIENSFEVFTFDNEKVIKRASTHHSDDFFIGAEGEVIVTLRSGNHGFYEKKYFWDGVQFLSE